MTVATNHKLGPVDAPVEPPKVVRQRRMRPGLLGLAFLLVALGGLGSAFAVTSVRATGAYLGVARPVSVGTALTVEDLVTIQVAGGQGLSPVPASDLDKVIGKRAAVTLTEGTLLTMNQLTDKPLLGPGQQQIAIGLKPAEVPAKRLRPGDKLLLVSTPASSSSNDDKPAQATRYEATVVDVSIPEDDSSNQSNIVVYLALAARDAPAVVTLAAQSRLAVVLTGAS